jgi:hypothetical protein
MSSAWESRHPSVKHFDPMFEYAHLPEDLKQVSAVFASVAALMLDMLHDGPELSAMMRKLVEAKDCAVRQAVLDRKVT